MQTVIPILIFILILSVVIFIHELGHFFFARRCGIFVEEFAMGMGPKLLQFKGKKKSAVPSPDGDEEDEVTLYTLRLFPIGGFCKMRGQDDDVPDDPEALNNKPLLSRILVIAGGSLMNFVLAFILFFALVMLRGFPVAEVIHVVPNMPGYNAGLMDGDRITHINGTRVSLYEEFMYMLDTSGGQPLDVRIDRGGERVDLVIAPEPGAQGYRIGFQPGRRFGILHSDPGDPDFNFQRVRVPEGFINAGETILFHIRAPFRLVARFVTRQPVPGDGGVVGIVGIGGIVTEVYQETIQHGILNTFLTMLSLTALLSAAIGIMNLMPIPALDGARLIFLVIEGIRRKPVPPEREAMVHMVGLVVLLLLFVFITYQDIMRLI